jgi:glycosyltransferase involved in cell wall biosynthesis
MPPAGPLVSVLVNNHNYRRFLAAAIDSALGQTYERTETIVVDDGSTDESRDVILRYGSRIGAVLKENGGQASAINLGFERCGGDIVIILDADDRLDPDIAGAVTEAFRAHPDVARVQYRVAVTDAAGRPTGERIPADYVTMPSGDLREGVIRFNNVTWWPPTSGHAFSAETLRRILPMPEEPFHVAVDYYLVRASALCGPIVSLERIGAYYRRHGQNEDSRDRLDLDQVRTQIELTREAHPYLKRFADSIGLASFAADAAEVDDLRFVAMRMMSLKLDPSRHPVPDDSLGGLARRGIRVAGTQAHLPYRVRLLAALWFVAILIAPAAQARELAEKYSYPRTRPWLDRILRRS